jgi:hypothetical protein
MEYSVGCLDEQGVSFRFGMPLELGRGFHRVRQQLVDQAMDIADELGIRFGDIDVVMVLGFRGTMRMGDLASRMVLAAPAATRIAKRLEGLGLIKRRRSEESNRVVLMVYSRVIRTGPPYPAALAAARVERTAQMRSFGHFRAGFVESCWTAFRRNPA